MGGLGGGGGGGGCASPPQLATKKNKHMQMLPHRRIYSSTEKSAMEDCK